MTQSKQRAKIHDVYVKTGAGTEDFGYLPLDQVKVGGMPLGEIIDQAKADANKRLESLEKEVTYLKQENSRLSKEVRQSLSDNEALRKRLDNLESVFEKNVREWLTR